MDKLKPIYCQRAGRINRNGLNTTAVITEQSRIMQVMAEALEFASCIGRGCPVLKAEDALAEYDKFKNNT